MNKNTKISDKQIRGMVISTVIGVGILNLPNILGKISGKDGWMPIILAGLILIPFIIMINKIFERNPGKDFFQIGRDSLGNIFFSLSLLLLAFHFLILISFVTRQLGELIKAFLLPATPIYVILIMILLPTVYLALFEIEVVARISYVIYPVILISIILLLLFAIPTAEPANILPQFQSDFWKLPKGILESFFAFTGFEILLFALPYIEDKKSAQKASVSAIIIISLIYSGLFILSLTQFSIGQIRRQNFPIVMIAKMIDLPGFFLQNLDTIFMAVWTMVAFGTMGPIYYALGKTLNNILGANKRRIVVLGLAPVIYIIAMLPKDILILYNQMGKTIQLTSIISIIIFPIIIYILGNRKGRSEG